MQNDQTTVAATDNDFDLDDLLLTAAQESDIKAGRDYTVGPPPPCPGCGWGGPMTNHNETVAEDSAVDIAALTDLPVTDDGQIKGGTVKLPDVLVSSYQSGGHSCAALLPHHTGALVNMSGTNTW